MALLTTMPCADLKIADGDGKRDLARGPVGCRGKQQFVAGAVRHVTFSAFEISFKKRSITPKRHASVRARSNPL